MVVNPDDISGIGFLDIGPLLGHENGGIGNFHIFADAVVPDLHPLGELTRTDPEKCDPVPVLGIHIGLDLKGKA